MSEVEKIKTRYEHRKIAAREPGKGGFYFEWYHRLEKELKFAEILRGRYGNNYSGLQFMEIGAGVGLNLYFFARMGFKLKNIWANELLEDRFEQLSSNFPGIHLEAGDASQLTYADKFDVILQSVVFTSILSDDFKQELANTMFRMTKKGGMILWYDFTVDNPKNPDVKGIGKTEIKKLFPDAKSITFTKVTLAPPIGRKVYKLYNVINFLFPFLRTHLIAQIEK